MKSNEADVVKTALSHVEKTGIGLGNRSDKYWLDRNLHNKIL